jgi:hypothetical protein
MNVVDSSGWLEYFTGGKNAPFFAPAIEDTENLLVPVICIYEVYRIRSFTLCTRIDKLERLCY